MVQRKKRPWAAIALIVVALAAAALIVWSGQERAVPRSAYQCLVYTEQGCAKWVAQSGGALEIQAGGALVITPGATVLIGADVGYEGSLRIVGPTAATTATPALVVDSLAAGAKLLEVADAGTPVFNIQNGGAWDTAGAGTHGSGQTVNNWVKMAAPTAIATATPAVVVDSLGLSVILEVRDAATPIARFEDGGVLALLGSKLDLDADGDTSFTADVDDVVDIEISAADDFQFSANTFAIRVGSKISVEDATNFGVMFVCEGSHDHTSEETAVTICVLPANFNIVDAIYVVDTQWNDGTGAVSDCGISGGDLDAYVDNMNVNDAADYNRIGDNADMPYATTFGDVGATDVVVVCQIAETDNDASAGAATLRVFYIVD